MPFFTGGGGTSLIVKEDNAIAVTGCSTIDFTEPLVTVVSESPTGEANVNLALYFLASAAREVTGLIISRDQANVLEGINTGDTQSRVLLSQISLKWGPGGSSATDVGFLRASAALGEFKGDWRFPAGNKLIFRDSNDTNQFTISAGNMAVDIDYIWPATAPVENNILKTSSAGLLAWTNLIGAKGGFTSGSVIFANSSGDLGQDNTNFFWDDTNDRLGIGVTSPATRQHNKETISKAGGVTDADGIAATLRLEPIYTRASGLSTYTITRHNYLELLNIPASAGMAVTDGCLFRTDAAAGTHEMIDAGTTKVSIGVVTEWLKVNSNGTVHFIPMYSSKTS